jgi:uncharacterized protein DUF3551
MNLYIIELTDVAPYLKCGQATSETNMKKRANIALATLFGSAAIACIALASSAAEAGPIVPSGHYCILYDEGGTDCSFTTYQQCEATASGLSAECYGNSARDDAETAPTFGWSAHRYAHY